MACRDGIHHDQEDIRRPRWRQGFAPSRPCRVRSPTQTIAPEMTVIATAMGKLIRTNLPEAPPMTLEARDEPCGHPQRHDQPGRAVDPGKSDQEDGRTDMAHRSRENSQRPRRGQARTRTPPTIPAAGRRRGSSGGGARRSGGSSAGRGFGSNICLRNKIAPASRRPATRPHQADRRSSDRDPGG